MGLGEAALRPGGMGGADTRPGQGKGEQAAEAGPPAGEDSAENQGGVDRMLTIIEIAAREDGGHGLESQSHRTECWMEGWIAVPEELVDTAWACRGYCDLTIEDGVLTGITPKEPPPLPEPEPTAEERLNDIEEAIQRGLSL